MNDRTRATGPGSAAGSPTSADHHHGLRLSVASEPVALADAIAELLERSDERDLYEKRVIAAEIRGYRRGLAVGDERGYLRAVAEHKSVQQDLVRCWREMAELERRRWGRGGRHHFADPRPGDHPGSAA